MTVGDDGPLERCDAPPTGAYSALSGNFTPTPPNRRVFHHGRTDQPIRGVSPLQWSREEESQRDEKMAT